MKTITTRNTPPDLKKTHKKLKEIEHKIQWDAVQAYNTDKG
jgi:hypothetical protein